jgi:hypothetical protein
MSLKLDVPPSPDDSGDFKFPEVPRRAERTGAQRNRQKFHSPVPRHTISSVWKEAKLPKNEYVYTPVLDNEIRVLLLQKGHWDDTIECGLKIIRLAKDGEVQFPEYEALSYYWGKFHFIS